jgi:hypothetical protein
LKQFKYLGIKFHAKCEMCGKTKTKQKMYEKRPHDAVVKLLVDQSNQEICRKCAEREIGSKRKKELDELEENS